MGTAKSAYLGSGAFYGLKILTLLVLDRQGYLPCASLPAPASLLIAPSPFSSLHSCFEGLYRRWGAQPLTHLHGKCLQEYASRSDSTGRSEGTDLAGHGPHLGHAGEVLQQVYHSSYMIKGVMLIMT